MRIAIDTSRMSTNDGMKSRLDMKMHYDHIVNLGLDRTIVSWRFELFLLTKRSDHKL